MSAGLKRSGDEGDVTSLVPVNKKSKSEMVAYAAKFNRSELRRSSLFAPIVQLAGHEAEVFCCKFSPDGAVLATAGFDRRIFLWNVYGECENWSTLVGHGGAILDLRFNHDGNEIVTCGTDKFIFIWDMHTLERAKKIKGHREFVNCIDVARNTPNMICSGSDDSTIKIWDRRKRGDAITLNSEFQVLAVSFNDDANQVISGGIDNCVKVWDIRKKEILYKLPGHADSITGLSLSPDGSYIASNAMDNTVRLWDIRPYATQERCIKLIQGHTHNFEKNLLRVAWSPDGQMISAGSGDKFLYVWEVNDGRIAYKLPGHTGSVNDVGFHPNEPIIVSCSSDRKVFLGEL